MPKVIAVAYRYGARVTSPNIPRKSLQHTLNNPLAGLLAELQLLQMEPLAPDHRAGVDRAVGLVRRLIQIVKDEVPRDL